MGMLSRNILDLLQNQYKHESANHFRYVARASWARYRGYDGAGDYFEREAKGEKHHAKMVRQYIEARNECVEPSGFEFNEPADFQFYDELFTTALTVEQETTDLLNNIYASAIELGDFMTSTWVQDLITRQIAEENEAQSIIDRIIQRGGGKDQVTAINQFRQDISASHDLDVWLKESLDD
jgi:ferritin